MFDRKKRDAIAEALAYKAWDRGKSQLAFQLFRNSARNGNVNCYLQLGVMYSDGDGVKKSHRMAMYWYLKLLNRRPRDISVANNIACQFRDLGLLHLAMEWHQKAKQSGNGDSNIDIGYGYQYGIGVKQDIDAAVRAYEEATNLTPFYNITQAGREEAMYHYAVLLLDKAKNRRDDKATALLKDANQDDDYPEARSLLEQLTQHEELAICRCRRGRYRNGKGQANCLLHARQ